LLALVLGLAAIAALFFWHTAPPQPTCWKADLDVTRSGLALEHGAPAGRPRLAILNAGLSRNATYLGMEVCRYADGTVSVVEAPDGSQEPPPEPDAIDPE
jgi:hypothetical protein